MNSLRHGLAASALLAAALLPGCASTEPSAEAIACAEYVEVKVELVETYGFIAEGGAESALRVHVDQLDGYAERIGAIDAPSDLAGMLAEMSEVVAQSAADARAALAGGGTDAMKATSAEMIYVEKPLLEFCRLG